MPARDALDRVAIARIAAETKWGVTPNRTQATAKARAALAEKFLRSADGDPVRAEHLRRAPAPRRRIAARTHPVARGATPGHARERERGWIVADLDDYAVVRELVADAIAEGVGTTVSETVRETVEAVAAIASPNGIELRALADRLKLDKSNVSRRLARAADGGYLRNLEDRRGKPGRWVIGDPLPEAAALLPDPTQLRNTAQPPDKDRCGVAPDSGGEGGDAGTAGTEGKPTQPPGPGTGQPATSSRGKRVTLTTLLHLARFWPPWRTFAAATAATSCSTTSSGPAARAGHAS